MSKSRESGKVPEAACGEGEDDVPLCVGRTTRYPFICLDAEEQLELHANSNTPDLSAYKLADGIYEVDGSDALPADITKLFTLYPGIEKL